MSDVTIQQDPIALNVKPPAGVRGGLPPWLRGLLVLFALYLFIGSVKMIGTGLKIIAEDSAGENFLNWLFSLVSDPFSGLAVGVLVTSLVQSSSFTTSMLVGLVAMGDISLTTAIPMIMGANIGTSVTNILVSLGSVRRRREFRRSFGAAIVHDFFNVLAVIILLPLEIAFGIISRVTEAIARALGDTPFFASSPTEHIGFIKTFFGVMGTWMKWLTVKVLHISTVTAGAIVSIFALILLFVALWMLVKMLKGLMQDRLSGVFSRTIFRNQGTSFAVGIFTTAAVQSSSVTTSLVVPLVGARVLKLKQIYPYTLGANIGTTVTAMLAALGTGQAPAVACAFGHLLFNCYATAIFWPLQFIPISLAKGFARMASRRRLIAAAYIVVVFMILPVLVIILMNTLRGG